MKALLTLFFALLWLNSLSQIKTFSQKVLISESGSNRATGYSDSNKIIELEDRTFVLTLDYIDSEYAVVIRVYNKVNGKIEMTVVDPKVKDDHGGGAIVMDNRGYIHIVYGPHNGPFIYRVSMDPYSIDSWSEKEYFGDLMTYPSLAIDNKTNTLYLLGRQSSPTGKWSILLFTKEENASWSSNPRPIITSDYKPWRTVWFKRKKMHQAYIRTYKSLVVDTDGNLHVAFKMFEYLSDNSNNKFSNSANAVSYMVGYISSNDGGNTWRANNKKVRTPVVPKNSELIVGTTRGHIAESFLNISNLTLDSYNNPYIAYVSDKRDGTPPELYIGYRVDNKWHKSKIDTDSLSVAFFGSSAIAITGNKITLAIASIAKENYSESRAWGHKDNRVAIIRMNKENMEMDELEIESNPSWMPSIVNFGNDINKESPPIIYSQGVSNQKINKVFMVK